MSFVYSFFNKLKRLRNLILYCGIIIVFIFFSIIAPNFFSIENLLIILSTMGVICVLGLGTTFVLTAGEIDISVAALLSVPTVVIATLLRAGIPLLVCLISGLAVALLFGLLNSVVTLKLKIPSFLTTIATMGIAMGASRTISSNASIKIENELLINIFGKTLFGIPKIILWMILLTTIGYFLLHKTRFGKNIHCIGDNRKVAFLYGINITKTVIFTFLISSVYTFFAGLLMIGLTTFGAPRVGEELLLPVIVVALIGGTSINGGRGNIIGTFFGAFFISLIKSGLFSMRVTPWWGNIALGIIIIIILSIGSLRENGK